MSEMYRVWPDDWRVVHYASRFGSREALPNIFGEIQGEFPYEVIMDGDCSKAWGEKKTSSCTRWHWQLYCHEAQVHRVLWCLRESITSGGARRSYSCVVTDANDWSRKVNQIYWPNPTCPFH